MLPHVTYTLCLAGIVIKMSKEKTMRSCKDNSFFQCGNMAKIIERSKALKEVGASKRGDGLFTAIDIKRPQYTQTL